MYLLLPAHRTIQTEDECATKSDAQNTKYHNLEKFEEGTKIYREEMDLWYQSYQKKKRKAIYKAINHNIIKNEDSNETN